MAPSHYGSGSSAGQSSVRQDEKLRAVDGLKRRQTNRAAAAQTPVNCASRDHSAAVLRKFREAGIDESLAMAKADNRSA